MKKVVLHRFFALVGIILFALSTPTLARPSRVYAAVLEETDLVFRFAKDHFALVGRTIICAPPTVRRVSDDLESTVREDAALTQDRLFFVQAIQGPTTGILLLDWANENAIGFGGWVNVKGQMFFWTMRCIAR